MELTIGVAEGFIPNEEKTEKCPVITNITTYREQWKNIECETESNHINKNIYIFNWIFAYNLLPTVARPQKWFVCVFVIYFIVAVGFTVTITFNLLSTQKNHSNSSICHRYLSLFLIVSSVWMDSDDEKCFKYAECWT